MITITVIVSILAIALMLLLIEILIIPGIGFPGIAGTILFLLGVILAYQIDITTGNITLLISSFLCLILGYLAFNNKTWDKLAQKEEITSKIEQMTSKIEVGTHGLTMSRLNPIGKAMIENEVFEVSSRGEYIEEASKIEITNIESNKIYVKKLDA